MRSVRSLSNRRESTRIVAFADGACRGNPGPGACAALIIDTTTSQVIASRSRYLSDQETNNTAEYQALLLALELADELQVKELLVHMDSELIVKQMRGQYRVKAPHLQLLHKSSRERCRSLGNVQFEHVPRELNALADRLANEALDQQEKIKNTAPDAEIEMLFTKVER